MYGRKSSNFDKGAKSVKFFNMFGELLQVFTDVLNLERVEFRPRPRDILKKDKLKALSKDYKKKYEGLFKEEEINEKKQQADIQKDQRKLVRDDFLNNFFIPARQQYEKDMDKYRALFPIRESDMAKEQADYFNIYAFKETISQRKIEGFVN